MLETFVLVHVLVLIYRISSSSLSPEIANPIIWNSRLVVQFQWVIYDCDARSVQLLEEFSPRQFFLKMYLPYFDMFAQGFTPWSPDASAFAYVAEKAAFIQEVRTYFSPIICHLS